MFGYIYKICNVNIEIKSKLERCGNMIWFINIIKSLKEDENDKNVEWKVRCFNMTAVNINLMYKV